MSKYFISCFAALMMLSANSHSHPKDNWIDVLSFPSLHSQKSGNETSNNHAHAKFNATKKELLIKHDGQIKRAKPGTYKLSNGKTIVVDKRGLAKLK